MYPRGALRSAIPERIALVLLSAVLVYGLVASPLLVQCIPGDGNPLVELIGQDPCHQVFGEIAAGSGHDFSFGADDPADPCLDLTLDNFGITPIVSDLQAPPGQVMAQLAEVAAAAVNSIYMPNIDATYKLAREPVILVDLDPLLTTALRI